MSQPGYGHPGAAGERWNVNMPAVIGVVFVFLVGVIVWVVTTGDDNPDGGGDDPAAAVDSTASTAAPSDPPTETSSAPDTTTEAPMPDPSAVTTTPDTNTSTTTSTTTVPTTTTTTTPPPATTAPGAPEGAVPGDLAIPDRPMQQPNCDGAFITVLASAIGDQATADGIARVLDAYPGSSYLRTDQTCPSLTPDIGGEPIYVVYLGPFAFDSDACAARSEGPEGAYARRLSDDLGPDHSVACG